MLLTDQLRLEVVFASLKLPTNARCQPGVPVGLANHVRQDRRRWQRKTGETAPLARRATRLGTAAGSRHGDSANFEPGSV